MTRRSIPGNLAAVRLDVAGVDVMAAGQALGITAGGNESLVGRPRDDRPYPNIFAGRTPAVQTFARVTAPGLNNARDGLATATNSLSTAVPNALQQLAALQATYGS